VACSNGERFEADACCLALPLVPLRRVKFDPPLPRAQHDALHDWMELGQAEKLFVVMERDMRAKASEGDGDASSEPGSVQLLWMPDEANEVGRNPQQVSGWTKQLFSLYRQDPEKVAAPGKTNGSKQAGGQGRCVLVGWLTGDAARAVSGRPSSELLPELVAGLAPFWGRPELGGQEATSWCADPSSGGAWSYPTARAPKDVAAQLHAPLVCSEPGRASPGGGHEPPPRVVFAGEATSKEHFGTVGGALESGKREADRLLRAWGVQGHLGAS